MKLPVKHVRIIYYLLFITCLLSPFFSFAQAKPEFRGVWVATVDNIDWPSRGNYNSDSQKIEFIKLLDLHRRNGINALIVQVRPAADAFYPSPYEPWSQWLTGRQGKPPFPFYDPLEFMIAEAHKRGLEFHAWINPYRAVFNINRSSVSPTHITRLHPNWFLTYGDKKYFDPGNKDVQQYVTSIVTDIVKRYNIDAIHFDDYFYPYKIAGKEFPDNAKYLQYGKGMSKDKWRRSNTDSIIVMISKAIKKENPQCRFGISPFGVWRNADKDPEGSQTKAGVTNYDELYADILLWLKKGWIDYVAPQLYWEIGHKLAPYEVLIDWWNKHTYGRHCYIGMGIYRANSNAAWHDKTQIPRQIKLLRNAANTQGMVFYSSNTFQKNPNGWNDSLQNNYYKQPALIPAMAWLDTVKPAPPNIVAIGLQRKDSTYIIHGKLENIDNIKKLVVYVYNADKINRLAPENIYHFPLPSKAFILSFPFNPTHAALSFGITAVSNTNVESVQQIFNRKE